MLNCYLLYTNNKVSKFDIDHDFVLSQTAMKGGALDSVLL